MKESIIRDKSFQFALDIIEVYKQMMTNNEYVLSKQLLRCGTSIGANVEEASAAISRNDFIHKISISSKEARETRYWLRLIKFSKIVELKEIEELLLKTEELIKILTSIVKSTQENNK